MFKEGTQQRQSIELLPVAEQKVHDTLHATEQALKHLKAMNARPDILSSSTCDTMISTYEEQVNQLLQLQEQCYHWHRTHYLTPSQKESLLALEKDMSRLEKLTQQILFMARHFTDAPRHTSVANEDFILSDEVLTIEFEPTAITAKDIDIMQAIHDTVIQLAAQGLEGIEIFEATLDYMPMVDDIVSRHTRRVVMDYADRYPGFREYILLLEALSEEMAGVQLNFMADR